MIRLLEKVLKSVIHFYFFHSKNYTRMELLILFILGKIIHRDGDFYEGDWKDDQANGYGIYSSPDGTQYEGEWKNDLQHGFGKEKWPDGTSYVGFFEKGEKTGRGNK